MENQRFSGVLGGIPFSLPVPGATAALRRTAVALCLAAAAGLTLSACSSGDGGDNGKPNYEDQQDNAAGLLFSYPYDGQQNVTLTSQIVFKAPSAFGGSAADAIALQSDRDDTPDIGIDVEADDNQPGIYRILPDQPLAGNTTYHVVATSDLAAGKTRFSAGDTLFQFTTAPTPGRPAAGDFQVTEAAPGETNPVTGRTTIFAQFDTVHVSLSETIDPSSVVAGDTFRFTNDDGDEIDGALSVSGHEITFDPAENLAPGTYTLALSDEVQSAFGKSLEPFKVSRTVLDSGDIVEQNLTVDNDNGFAGDSDDSILNGENDNRVTLATQLIGVNNQPARNQSVRRGVLSRLATPGMPGFDDVFPNSIPAGQTIELKPLAVRLDGEVSTPVVSGPIQVQFGSDANVYLMSNDYRNVTGPTAVRLRFDLNNTTLISAAPGTPDYIVEALSNGVFNQSALNIQAAGLAIPQDNGDLVLSTIGTFPLTVNRTDGLTVDFALTLRLPAADQTPVVADTSAPYVTAQSPSACLYTFGTPAFDAAYGQFGAAPTVLPEQNCVSVLNSGGTLDTASGINSFPIESSPAVTFSEPLDPLSVNTDSISLVSGSGTVDASYSVDGSSVTINPDEPLEPDTQYTITLGGGSALRDLAGNTLVANAGGGPGQSIRFTTEPLVDDDAATNGIGAAPVILGELSPGVPCALGDDRGDFRNGGDVAGQCVGDADNGTTDAFDVFTSPSNVPVVASFSKFVTKSSVVLADGCLTSGSGDDNTVGDATVALERIDGSGQCMGTPDAALAFANRDGDITRGFSIRPVGQLEPGSRYWIVVCGNEDSACSRTITDVDGLALNTDPLNGTGSTPKSQATGTVAGGPDIVMPFDVGDYSTDYYADQFTLPATDSNGNGQFDDANGNGGYDENDERPQPGNRNMVDLTLLGTQIMNANREDGLYPNYLSLTRPIAIREALDDCSVTDNIVDDDGNNVIGSTPDDCIQVSLLPGGFSALTGIGISLDEALPVVSGVLLTPLSDAAQAGTPLGDIPVLGPVLGGVFDTTAEALQTVSGAVTDAVLNLVPLNSDQINTGRVILRFPDLRNDDGSDAGAQSGYIVPECQGSLNGQSYDYAPCFVASLNLVANGPDGQGVTLDQQDLTVNVVGPVSFEQNGRLVISLRNANTFALQAKALGLLPSTATIASGNLNFQLVGNAIHGGRVFPQR